MRIKRLNVAETTIKRFYSAMPWGWSDLDVVIADELFYGSKQNSPSGEIVSCADRHPSRLAFRMLKRNELMAGNIMQLRFLLASFRNNVDALFDKYDLSEDGVVKTDLLGLPDVLLNASGLVYDIIVSGRRFVDHIEDTLKSQFGEESEEFKTWKDINRNLYNESLPYALCYRLRNLIEHRFVAISTVNFNPQEQAVGLAINLEAGILQYESLNAGVRERVVKYREERLAAGLVPWMSVGGTMSAFESIVLLHYFWFLAIVKETHFARGLPAIVLKDAGKSNCLVWKVGNDPKQPLYSLDRVYGFSKKQTIVSIVEHDIEEIGKRLVELRPDREDDIRSLVNSKLD